MSMVVRVGLAALVAMSVSAQAAPKTKVPTYEVIIVAGGTTDEEAKAAQEKATRLLKYVVKGTEGFPKLLVSDNVDGLKPGFQILVAGFCAKKADALVVRDLFNASGFEGVYTRTVKGDFEGKCPQLKTVPRRNRGMEKKQSVAVVEAMPSLTWNVYTTPVSEDPQCDATRVVVQVEYKNAVLESEEWTGYCQAPRFEGDLGSSTSYSAAVETLYGKTYLEVHTQEWAFDTPQSSCAGRHWTEAGLMSLELDESCAPVSNEEDEIIAEEATGGSESTPE